MKQNAPLFFLIAACNVSHLCIQFVNYSFTERHLTFASLLLLYINAENKVTTHGFLLLSVFVGDRVSEEMLDQGGTDLY